LARDKLVSVTNEKNNINELVFDDDPTAELEVIALRRGNLSSLAAPLECDEHTSDLENTSDFESTSDLKKRGGDDAQIVSKLKYDIEQLRARWMGLEAENKAREEVTATLTAELHKIRDALAAKNDLLVSRNEEIESLKSELHKQEAQYHATVTRQEQEIADMRETMRFIPEPAAFAPTQADDADDQTRHQRTEAYADSLRHKLQDLLTLHDNLKREHRRLEASLQQSDENGQQLAAKLATGRKTRLCYRGQGRAHQGTGKHLRQACRRDTAAAIRTRRGTGYGCTERGAQQPARDRLGRHLRFQGRVGTVVM
jgi:chromosome segregation ATPase